MAGARLSARGAVLVALLVGALAQDAAAQRATPTLVTSASPNITLGAGNLTDTAFVFGRVNPLPGATIDFALYGPDDLTCAGPPLFQTVNVPYPVEGGPVTSAALRPAQAGTYRWRATYSGDANNMPVAAPCNEPGENVVVTLPPGGTPTPGAFLPLLSPFPVVRVVGRTTLRGVKISLMTVRAKVGNMIISRCVGSLRHCPYRQRISEIRGRAGAVRTIRVRGFERPLRAGISLRVYVVNGARTGKFTSLQIVRGRLPARTDGCVAGLALRRVRCPVG